MIDQHHLLECILWPNVDGTFRKIINRAKRLEDLGVYNDYKLTIPIDHSTHQKMHRAFEKGTEYERIGEKCGMYGKGYLIAGRKGPMYGRVGENHPMYGRTREKHPTWKGDKAGQGGMYFRALKLYKSEQMTEEEFQPYRDAWAEYHREWKRRAKQKASEN